MSSNASDSDRNQADKSRIETVLETARGAAGSAYHAAVEKTSAAYEAAREKTGSAYSSARETASAARERTGAGIDDNPLAALAGGLALGALAGALLPRSQREIDTLAPIGEKLRAAAGSAGAAAKAAAAEKIGEFGLAPDDLVAKAKAVLSEAASAVQSKAGEKAGRGGADADS